MAWPPELHTQVNVLKRSSSSPTLVCSIIKHGKSLDIQKLYLMGARMSWWDSTFYPSQARGTSDKSLDSQQFHHWFNQWVRNIHFWYPSAWPSARQRPARADQYFFLFNLDTKEDIIILALKTRKKQCPVKESEEEERVVGYRRSFAFP